MSVIPFFEPSTTPVWNEVNNSGHGIGVGDAPKALTNTWGKSATTVLIFSPFISDGSAICLLVLAKFLHPPVLPIVISLIVSPESLRAMDLTVLTKSLCITSSAILSSAIKYGKSRTWTYGNTPAAPPEVEI